MKSLIEQMQAGAKDMDSRNPKKKTEETITKESFASRLQEKLDEHLCNYTPYYKKRNGFAPSDTIMCGRRDVYLMRGVEFHPDISGRLKRIFDNGNSFHERITKYFDDMDILIGAELELSSETPPIPKCFLDALIFWEGELVILEFKSVGEEGFAWRKDLNKPKDDHVRQLRIYMRLMGMYNIRKSIIIYENKNTQELLFFSVEQDDAELDKVFSKWNKTWKIFQDGNLPKRPMKSKDSKKCQWCEVRDMCWDDPEVGV